MGLFSIFLVGAAATRRDGTVRKARCSFLICAWRLPQHEMSERRSDRFGLVVLPCLRFEGDDVLNIESPPMPHPNVDNKTVKVIVTWARDKS